MKRGVRSQAVVNALVVVAALAVCLIAQQQPSPPQFGGAYASLDARRQVLVSGWVERFYRTTGQRLDAARFYDELLSQSTKTTFEAVTHALMTSPLTDGASASLGDALSLVERVEAVRGEVADTPSDRQFRMFARLTADALATLKSSQEFKRGADNSVFHKGYPTNYREQGGTPSVQISIARDGRRADIDVDYRSSTFPVSLFNGHMTSSNSDVRAGDNYDRHLGRWTGIQNWWGGFFGVHQERAPDVVNTMNPFALPKTPRAGKKAIEEMVNDFLTAWLVEGDVVAAMGYVSEHSYACLAQDHMDPSDFDRGLAPYQVMNNMKNAYDALGPHASLDGLMVGTRLTRTGLRVVNQPHHAQFVLYSVRDDVAASFDCESRLTIADPKKVPQTYGRYYGTTFYIGGRTDSPVALLWAQDDGYWKIASWKVGSDTPAGPDPEPVATPNGAHVNADPALVQAARDFLESWLVRKNYDAAFAYLAPESYVCYNLERGPLARAATSPEDGGRILRTKLEAAGQEIGTVASLESIMSAVEPVLPSVRVMNHPYSRAFTLTSPPNALADAVECAVRNAGSIVPDPMPLEYGAGFGTIVRFKTRSGDAPVLRLLWRKQGNAWRITAYGIEMP
jgi:hypothetical protein